MTFTITHGFLQKCNSWEIGILTLAAAFFSFGQSFPLGDKRKPSALMQMIFAKKLGLSLQILRDFFSSSAIAVFRQAVCQNVAGFYIFILFSLTSSKIWLILFEDDHEVLI
jgi:hypothetical protein